MSFLKKLKSKITSQKTIEKKPYTVPTGWINWLTRSDIGERYYGQHHKYEGIYIDKDNQPQIFAARDLVLSFTIANGRFPNESSRVIKSSFIIDLVCDTIGAKDTTTSDQVVFENIKRGLPHLSAAMIVLDNNFQDEKLTIGLHQPNEIKTNCGKTSVDATCKTMSKSEIDDIILFASRLLDQTDGLREMEFWLMAFLMSISKAGNCMDRYIEKRVESFGSSGKIAKIFLSNIDAALINEIWKGIKYHIDLSHCSVDEMISNVSSLVAVSPSVILSRLIDQIAYTNLTAIMTISRTLTTLSDFPWNGLATRMAAITKELKLFGSLLGAFEKNRYDVGLIVSGNSKKFPNLSYISVQLQIRALGNQSTSQYKGIGSKNNSSGINQQYFDDLIDEYLKDRSKALGSYSELKDLNVVSSAFGTATRLMTDYMGGDDDDSDDKNNGHPGHRSSQRPLPHDGPGRAQKHFPMHPIFPETFPPSSIPGGSKDPHDVTDVDMLAQEEEMRDQIARATQDYLARPGDDLLGVSSPGRRMDCDNMSISSTYSKRARDDDPITYPDPKKSTLTTERKKTGLGLKTRSAAIAEQKLKKLEKEKTKDVRTTKPSVKFIRYMNLDENNDKILFKSVILPDEDRTQVTLNTEVKSRVIKQTIESFLISSNDQEKVDLLT